MRFFSLDSAETIAELVQEIGFLPFFQNDIEGFSIEENCPRELWFSDTEQGPWEWKGPVIRTGRCVYGKIFRGKAGYISLDWLPDFANYRRDGYDFDARFDDELASFKDKTVYDTVVAHGSLLSKELKKLCNYRKDGNKGFDTVITRLQMQSYICISNFEYAVDKAGKTYGWGIARYSTPEECFGRELVTSAYRRSPLESRDRILAHLKKLLPEATEKQLLKLIGI